MDDDNGLEVLRPKKGSKKKVSAVHFNIINSLQWYKDYADVSDILTDQLMYIHEKHRLTFVQDVVQFVSSYEYTAERIPVISLFTGFNLPDHSSLISMVAERIKYNKEIKCRMVNLNPAKTTSLKVFIETIASDFVNCTDDKDDDDSFGSEETNLQAKSKLSLLRLTKWYSDTYGSLDESDRIDNDEEITHLIIVIPDMRMICKKIFNDFLRTISCFRNRLPFMFVIGVPYTLNAFETRFSYDVYNKIVIYPFQSQPCVDFLDTILEEVFLSNNSIFHMDAKVFKLLETAYTNYNYSVKEFIRGVKLSVLEHFSQSPTHATFCCSPENNSISQRINDLAEEDINLIFDLPSMQKYNSVRRMNKQDKLTAFSPTVKTILKNLYNEFQFGVTRFYAAVRCLNSLMKSLKQKSVKHDPLETSIGKIYLDVTDPDKRNDWLDNNLLYVATATKPNLLSALKNVENTLKEYKEGELTSIRSKLSTYIKKIEESRNAIKKSPVCSPIDSVTPTKVTRSPVTPIRSPAKLNESPVKPTRSPAKLNGSPIKSPLKMTTPKSAIRSSFIAASISPNRSTPSRRALFADTLKTSAHKAKLQSEFIEARKDVLNFLKTDFFKPCLKSLDDIPLGELFIYKDADRISSAMGNFFLSALNNALETPVTYLECKCCVQDAPDEVIKTMPDLAIMFKLHKECGRNINLYDWFQQFRSFVEKKKKFTDDDIDPDIFRRFCLAAQELHYLGYLSHVKKKPNKVEFVSKLMDF